MPVVTRSQTKEEDYFCEHCPHRHHYEDKCPPEEFKEECYHCEKLMGGKVFTDEAEFNAVRLQEDKGFECIDPDTGLGEGGWFCEECRPDEQCCDECGISTAGRKIRGIWDNELCEDCGKDTDDE